MEQEEALDWTIRTRDPDFRDWDAFTRWLEAAPGHAAAYDALMLADADLPALVPAEPLFAGTPANDRGAPASRWRWRWIGGGAIAAALVAALSIGMTNRADIYTVDTRPGEVRVIALDDGTRIEINGGSRLRLDHNDPRFAALDSGEASFTVTHDASDPFRVTVGDTVFEDAGTIFNIVRAGDATRIGVAEGEVIYNPDSDAISLPAGRALREDGRGLTIVSVAPESVASWRQGRLAYDNAPLADVTGDIARSLGIRIVGAPPLRFTGTILLDRDPQRFFARAAPLLGVTARHTRDGWILKERDGPQS
ncbi:FecR domain-containing protein [Sphingobium sp. AN641]|uniref:FecR family protein n=1 Tax=Sphingobium sp. AN641 TaxID=3133443 RepID=UPI0030BFEAD7